MPPPSATPTNTPTTTPTTTPTQTPTNTPTQTMTYNYYLLYVVPPGGNCASGALAQVKTTDIFYNNTFWYCCTYNGNPGYKFKYYSAGTPGTRPIIEKTGTLNASCTALTC